MDPVNIPAKFEVLSFTRFWENTGYSKNLGSLWIRPAPFSPKFLKGFCLDGVPVNIPAKFEVCSFTHSWDDIGYSKKWKSLDMPTLLFLQNFPWACVRMDPVNTTAKFEVRNFSRSWDNSDCSFGVGLRTSNLGQGEAVRGRGWYRSKER